MKLSRTYRIHKENLNSLEKAVKAINSRLGCNAYDNTKVIESLISLYLEDFVDKVMEKRVSSSSDLQL